MTGKKILLAIVAVSVLGLAAAIALSPYGKKEGFAYPLMKTSVEINATPDSVFRFLGNSDNARRWSVFVNHIKPLNADSIKDGQPGARRRCFCKGDESGRRWDETITEMVPGKKRQLICYAFVDFPVSAQGLATEQLYQDLGNGKMRLTFTFFFKDRKPSLIESFCMYLSAYRVNDIFVRNMNNVKRLVETGT